MMAAKAAVMATTSAAAGLPLLVVGAIIMLMVSLLMWLITTVAVADDPPARPASSKCPNRPSPRSNGPPNPVGTDFIAVLMRRESGFDPEAYANDSNGGTWGLLQINRSVWRGVHPEGADQTPPQGITDPNVHAQYGGIYLKTGSKASDRSRQATPTRNSPDYPTWRPWSSRTTQAKAT